MAATCALILTELRGASIQSLIKGGHGVMLRFTQIIIAAFADVPLGGEPLMRHLVNLTSRLIIDVLDHADREGRRASQMTLQPRQSVVEGVEAGDDFAKWVATRPGVLDRDGLQSIQALPEFARGGAT